MPEGDSTRYRQEKPTPIEGIYERLNRKYNKQNGRMLGEI